MGIPRLPMPIEMHVVALIARGDNYDSIRSEVWGKFERGISAGAITAIKKRNEQALATIKEALTKKERDDAEGLLNRSHRLIGKQLRKAEEEGDTIKINDLVAISKEMFHQNRVSQGLPSDPAALANPKEKLKELQELLEENDEIRLERIVFAKREQTSSVPPQDSGDQPADNGATAGDSPQG